MGQQQTYEKKSLSELIKDVATFNLLAKSGALKSYLKKTLQAEVTKKQPSLKDQIMFFKQFEDLHIGMWVDKKYILMNQQHFQQIKQLLQDLASFVLQDPQKEDGTCQICFEKKIDKLLPCGHSYCQDCLEGWFIIKEQDSCPMCRAQLTKQRIQNESYYVPNENELIDSIREQIEQLIQQ